MLAPVLISFLCSSARSIKRQVRNVVVSANAYMAKFRDHAHCYLYFLLEGSDAGTVQNLKFEFEF